MNLEPLMIGQNLLCRLTAEKAGLTCWALPAPGFGSAGVAGGWPGPDLSVLAPCSGIALSCSGVTGTGLPVLMYGGGVEGAMTTGGAVCCPGAVPNTGASATCGAARCSMTGLFG